MTLLDQLEAQLRRAGTTTALAAYRNPRLGMPAADDIRIFIPDLHLLSASARQYAGKSGPTPSHALLQAVLRELIAFRANVKAGQPSGVCAVYFMGDTLDLWREAAPGCNVPTAVERISGEHQMLLGLACSPELKARFLLGNHDFELFQAVSFRAADRRYFFPPLQPTTVVLHGDVFDWIEDFPDLFNEVVVYYLQPFYNHLDHLRDRIARMLRQDPADPPAPAAPPQVLSRCDSREQAQEHHRLFARAWQGCQKASEAGMDLRCVVIGHTHTPQIVAYECGNEFLALVDAGAWIQDARDTEGVVESGTIAAMCANEVRIFQVSAS